jgi:hypothetical protein
VKLDDSVFRYTKLRNFQVLSPSLPKCQKTQPWSVSGTERHNVPYWWIWGSPCRIGNEARRELHATMTHIASIVQKLFNLILISSATRIVWRTATSQMWAMNWEGCGTFEDAIPIFATWNWELLTQSSESSVLQIYEGPSTRLGTITSAATQGLVWPEGLHKLKKLIYLIVSRTRNLPVCSILHYSLRYRVPPLLRRYST